MSSYFEKAVLGPQPKHLGNACYAEQERKTCGFLHCWKFPTIKLSNRFIGQLLLQNTFQAFFPQTINTKIQNNLN